jgi:hypothetical protein
MVLVAFSSLACGDRKNAYDPTSRVDGGPVKVVGSIPDRFDCKAFLPEAPAIAGGEVSWQTSKIPAQHGATPPCAFARADDEAKYWQFSMDCRKVAEGEVDFFIKLQKREAEEQAKAPPPPRPPRGSDAGVHRPLVVKDIAIGKRGLDNSHGQLVFVDDDTSCGVWINGPDEASRLALAQAIAPRLTADNAPRLFPRGRPQPQKK